METTMGTTGQQQKAGIDRVSQTAHEAVDRAAQTAAALAERVTEKSDELMHYTDQWVEGTRSYVREHPMAALGMALAAGYLLSMIMRSSR
jgi:ElaB/YqjD/DUF883 family membrane-anchored ribosome-binding protein